MRYEHQVLARPVDGDRQVFVAAFELEQWQWAEKLARFLTDKGCDLVEVVLAEESEEAET